MGNPKKLWFIYSKFLNGWFRGTPYPHLGNLRSSDKSEPRVAVPQKNNPFPRIPWKLSRKNRDLDGATHAKHSQTRWLPLSNSPWNRLVTTGCIFPGMGGGHICRKRTSGWLSRFQRSTSLRIIVPRYSKVCNYHDHWISLVMLGEGSCWGVPGSH